MGIFIPPGTTAGTGGGAPGGTGSEIQYRIDATTFGGIAGSSVDPATGNTTFSARWISTRNGAASAPAHALTGTWFSGGTAETTKPHFLIEPTGATSNGWNVNGTGFGVNAPAGFTGELAWLGVDGTPSLTVNAGGVVDVADAGSFQFRTGRGMYWSGMLELRTAFGGVLVNTTSVDRHFSLGIASGTPSVSIYPEAFHVWAQRNGANAQTFRLYNTWTSDTNFERGRLSWAGNTFLVGTEKGTAGGAARGLELQTDSVTRIRIGAAGQIGFFGAAAVAQPAAIPNATDAASTQTGLNSVLAALRSLGLIAT